MDISAFFRAFFSDWVGWMSSLGSIALTLFGIFRPSANQKRAFFLAAAVCFVVTCIHIWTIEHRARLRAEDIKKPRLAARIVGSMTARNDHGQAILTLTILIENRGAPSVVFAETVTIKLKNGKEIQPSLMLPPLQNIILQGAKGSQNITLKGSDYLLNKAIDQPIVRGGAVIGWMMFVLPEISQETFLSQSPEVLFKCEDVDGNSIAAPLYRIQNGPHGHIYQQMNLHATQP